MSGPENNPRRETMGSPEPAEQETDTMGGETRRGRERETMGNPEPAEQETDVMGGAEE